MSSGQRSCARPIKSAVLGSHRHLRVNFPQMHLSSHKATCSRVSAGQARAAGLAWPGWRPRAAAAGPVVGAVWWNQRMLETPDEMNRLQQLLDESAAGAGAHLRGIITDERRLSARQVTDRLQGMCLLVVATVTGDGRPLAGG